MSIPDLLTTDQCAALAGVSRPTVLKAITDFRLVAVRIGKQRGWTIHRAAAIAYRDEVAASRAKKEKQRKERARSVTR